MEINSEAGTLTNINNIAKAFNSYFINITEDLINNSSDVEQSIAIIKEMLPRKHSSDEINPSNRN